MSVELVEVVRSGFRECVHRGSLIVLDPRGEVLIHEIKRESKPGRRIYRRADDLERPLEGLGMSIVSTSRGVLSDRQCREARVGGELLATVY